jgi:hypothetical protein
MPDLAILCTEILGIGPHGFPKKLTTLCTWNVLHILLNRSVSKTGVLHVDNIYRTALDASIELDIVQLWYGVKHFDVPSSWQRSISFIASYETRLHFVHPARTAPSEEWANSGSTWKDSAFRPGKALRWRTGFMRATYKPGGWASIEMCGRGPRYRLPAAGDREGYNNKVPLTLPSPSLGRGAMTTKQRISNTELPMTK